MEEFIEEIQRRAQLVNMTDAELLLAIPEALNGTAKLWYNAMGSGWDSWGDFCLAARSHFGIGQDFQSNLEIQIQNRTQGPGEPVRTYIFSMLALMSKLETPYAERKKLVLLYYNLKYEIKSYLWAKTYKSVDVAAILQETVFHEVKTSKDF